MPQLAKSKVVGSGRKAGTPNRRSQEVRDLLESMNCDPITGMARIAMDESVDLQIRARMYTALAQDVAPKRKAIEHSGEGAVVPVVVIK